MNIGNLFKTAAMTLFAAVILLGGCSFKTGPTPMSQELQDEYTLNAFIDIFWHIYDQNIAHQTVGEKDFTVNGPEGGFVHVAGYNWYDVATGQYPIDFVCEFYNYHQIKEIDYDLIVTGRVHVAGSYNSSFVYATFTADSISFMGNLGT
ncbi:MAG: hypothetical protein PHW02_07180, partial [bacterium]|nr:hypothetical protein [bacterium]